MAPFPPVVSATLLSLCLMVLLVGCPTTEDPDSTDSDDDDSAPADDDDVLDDDDDDSDSGVSAIFHPTWPDVPPIEHEDTIDPPEGVTEADPTVPSDIASDVEFIYSGDDASQFGVAEDTIEDYRVAVVRGRVLQSDGTGLADVEITVLGHEELGYTLSRVDGGYDIVVNGGGVLTVQFVLSGYLTSQRQLNVPWRNFTWVPDVVLIQPDTEVTEIDLLSATAIQTARGSVVSDEDGDRQATMMFPPAMSAVMTLPDGTEQPLETLNVRATEYTVRDYGYDSMPGNLPATSAYTYAVELSIDEALAAGATRIDFDEPVPYYIDNFIGFPVGVTVPAGYYDAEQGVWVAAESGVIIEVLDTTGGYADIDVDGSGLAADSAALDELGITEVELEELAALYTVGETLWRVPLSHFTPYDLNMSATPPNDAVPPDGAGLDDNGLEDDVCYEDGSIIECQNQILGESVPITGTPFSLDYRSHRTPGWRVGQTLPIRVSGEEVPESLKRIELVVQIGGRLWEYTLSHCPDQVFTFEDWNGLDAYGREIQGRVPVQVSIGYVYGMLYQTVSTFGDPPGDNVISYNYEDDGGDGIVTGDCDEENPVPPSGVSNVIMSPAPYETTLYKEWTTTLGNFDAQGLGLGGWTLDVHHVYDQDGRILYKGDGNRQRHELEVITTEAGNGGYQNESGLGGPAISASIGEPRGIDIGPDGSIYIAAYYNNSKRDIFRVDPEGTITTVAGNGTSGYNGDGIPANQASVASMGVAVADDGRVFIADTDNNRVRMVDLDGIITTVAGCGTQGSWGDGGLATDAYLDHPEDVAVGADGSLYIADTESHLIRRVTTDGRISTYAGSEYGCVAGDLGDGGLAVDALLCRPRGVDVGADGSVYIADTEHNQIRRVGPDGIIELVAGNGSVGHGGDGGLAEDAELTYPYGVNVGPFGNVYIADTFNHRVRRVDTQGFITTVAGTGLQDYDSHGGAAADAALDMPYDVAVAPDGSLYIGDGGNYRVRRVAAPVPVTTAGEIVLPAEDGSEVYVFGMMGRHDRTVAPYTGAILYEFGYGNDGLLSTISDGDDNVTTIERDGNGYPTAVIAPGGQETTLSLDADGYLHTIANPDGDTYEVDYWSANGPGLIARFTSPRGHSSEYFYDADGRLNLAADAAGGTKTFARTDMDPGYEVSLVTGLGRNKLYTVENTVDGDHVLTYTSPAGATNERIEYPDGRIELNEADGMFATASQAPDPRWMMLTPTIDEATVCTPSGTCATMTTEDEVGLTDPYDPLSLEWLTSTTTINGDAYVDTFDAASQLWTSTTPEGRETLVYVDNLDRPVEIDIDPAVSTVTVTYDVHGNPEEIAQENLAWTYTYDAQFRPESITDALGNETIWAYDSADRVIQTTLPSGRVYGYSYDASGNPETITMPSGDVHDLGYTALEFDESYTPPGGLGDYLYAYDFDRDLAVVTLPSGRMMTYTREAVGGRLESVEYDEASIELHYDDATPRINDIITDPTIGDPQSLSYEYDGSLVTEVAWDGPAEGTFGYTYDEDFAITNVTLTTGADTAELPFTRDDDGLLTGYGPFTLTRNGPAGAVDAQYDASSDVTYGYNSLGWMSDRVHNVAGGEVYSLELLYDAAGRIEQKTETTEGVDAHVYDYTYDPDGQLTDVLRDGQPFESYSYDDNGNRTSLSATYDNQDRLDNLDGVAYQFDDDGFLEWRDSDEFVYSTRGELLQATVAGDVVTYTYDGIGRRMTRTDDDGTTQYLYGNPSHPLQLTATTDSDGVKTLYHYDSNSQLSAFQRGQTYDSADWYYVATDQVGTPKVVTDAAGIVVKVLEQDSWGVVLFDSDAALRLDVGFAGGIPDEVTGLVRFGWRDYEPAAGRWTAKDPILFYGGQANLYSYVDNNPICNIDPLGLYWLQDLSDFAAGFGDTVSFGLTKWFRQKLGVDSVVNTCSNWYSSGKWAGYGYLVASAAISGGPGGAAATRSASRGLKYLKTLKQHIKDNFFRMETGSWKHRGVWQSGRHFHLDPIPGSSELMKHHLPQQGYSWYKNLRSILRRK